MEGNVAKVFDPITIGQLALRNRFMRSATAEGMADATTGAPYPRLADMYRALADGEVGLIVTGHVCVAYSGRTNSHMAAMATDELIEPWRRTIRPAQSAGARVMLQINHGGASVAGDVVDDPISPSGVCTNELVGPRSLTDDEVRELVRAYGQAARRAREAGFDGVQIHAAHGYLISQFLTPSTNQRDDAWGGDEARRLAFLRAVYREVRDQVGEAYPVWIKLGVAGSEASDLTIEAGARNAAVCARMGLECIEMSHALGIPETLDTREEANYRPMAEAVRDQVGPEQQLALVSGFSSLLTMQQVIDSGLVQLISLCRPFIAEPDLVRKLRTGKADRAFCVRCGRCGAQVETLGITCNNEGVQRRLRTAY